MFSSNMFDGLISMLIIIGLVAGIVIVGIPMYFVGRYYGKHSAYEEAVQHQVLDIRYDQKTGVKEYIWKTNF